MSMRDLEVLSSIDPITTTSTSTGDSECVSKRRVMRGIEREAAPEVRAEIKKE